MIAETWALLTAYKRHSLAEQSLARLLEIFWGLLQNAAKSGELFGARVDTSGGLC